MIDQYGYVIEEENRVLIEGHRLLDPKVPHNNYWEDTNGVGPRKRNYTATSDREVFRKKAKMPEITMHGKVKMKEVKVVRKECMINETLHNVYFLKNNGIDNNSKPVD